MELREIVKSWFYKWEEGDYLTLPLAEEFEHTSPYGVIKGKQTYLNLVKENEEKFAWIVIFYSYWQGQFS